MQDHIEKVGKIAVFGAKPVGAGVARHMAELELADSIVLLDVRERRANRAAVDIRTALAARRLESPVRAGSSWDDAEGADIAVVTAGRGDGARRTGWDDLLAGDPRIIRDVAAGIRERAPEAVVVVAAHPVARLTQIVQQVTEFPAGTVLGTGCVLESLLFELAIARAAGVELSQVSAEVLGGQGDAMIPLVSTATIDGELLDTRLDQRRIAAVVDRTRREAADPSAAPDADPAYAAVRVVRAIVDNELATLACTVRSEGEYGTARGAWLALPVVVGRPGSMGVTAMRELSTREQEGLWMASLQFAPQERTQADE